VLTVASAWHHRRWGSASGGDAAAQKLAAAALAAVVRFGRLSPTVAGTVAAGLPWVRSAVSLEDLLQVAVFAAGSPAYQAAAASTPPMGGRVHAVVRHPAWALPPRPPSAVTRAVFTVEVTARELEAAAQLVLSGEASSKRLRGCSAQFYRGFLWQPTLQVARQGSGVLFGAYVSVRNFGADPGPGQCVPAKVAFRAIQEWQDVPEVPLPIVNAADFVVSVGYHRGWRDFFCLGPQASWDPAAWAAEGLLLKGGKVRVEVELTMP
jgi:hypothetical protein